MRVTRLEVFGFKSFMDRLVLPMEGGVTGVVGPNGCGKSNIVDAIRWVLGETKASSLRGDSLEDVIFNGTDKLRPLGLAEVTLTIRANQDNLFEDLISSSIEADLIARSVEQEVQAEPVEVLAVEEPISGVSTADEKRPHLTVIEGSLGKGAKAELDQDQGQSQDQDPARGQQQSGTLLARFSWLKSVSEVQVTRRLYRAASRIFHQPSALPVAEHEELFRAVGLSGGRTDRPPGKVSRIVTRVPPKALKSSGSGRNSGFSGKNPPGFPAA